MTIRPKQSDIDLLVQLIDMRESARLAGHRQAALTFVEMNGTEAFVDIARVVRIAVPTLAMARLRDLDLFHILKDRDRGFTFDLVDDHRDRLEEMRASLGQPSRIGEAQAATESAMAGIGRAEASQHALEYQVEAAAALRANRRDAFAHRAGRRVRLAASLALGALYVAIVVAAGYFLSSNLPLALVVGIVGVTVVLAVLDWLFRIDGFGITARAESWVVERITRWLESFEGGPDPGG